MATNTGIERIRLNGGGGIIFPNALLLQALISGFEYPLFNLGLLIIGFVSFYDDLRPISHKIRLFEHLIAVSLLFMEAGLMNFPIWSFLSPISLLLGQLMPLADYKLIIYLSLKHLLLLACTSLMLNK